MFYLKKFCHLFNQVKISLQNRRLTTARPLLIAKLVNSIFDDVFFFYQESIVHSIFEYLIENRPSMTKEKLESILQTSSPTSSSASGYSTPFRSRIGHSSLGESYTSSPGARSPNSKRDSPLQQLRQAQINLQRIEKLQQELRETKLNLSEEKSEVSDLRSEVETLKGNNEKLKHELETTKSKLYKQNANQQNLRGSSSEVSDLQEKYENLQKKLTELKDAEKYAKSLSDENEKLIIENQDLRQKNELQNEKLNEKNSILICHENKVTSLEMKLMAESEESNKLQEMIKELKKEIQDQQDATQQRHFSNFQNETFEMDVSIDNPRKILSPQPAVGEAMSEIVTLQLEQQIDELKNDMNAKSTAFAEEKESLLKTISDVQTEAAKTQETLAQTQGKLESINSEKEELRTNLSTLQFQIEDLKQNIVEKEILFETKTQEFEVEKERMSSELELLTNQSKQEIEQLKSETTAKTTAFTEEKESLLAKISDTQNNAAQTQEMLCQTQEKLESIILEKNGLQTNLSTLQSQIEGLMQNILDKDAMFETKTHEFEVEKEKMSSQLEVVTNQSKQEIEQMRSEMTANAAAFDEEKESLLNKISDVQNEATKTQENHAKMLESLESINLEKEAMQTNLSTLQCQIDGLKQNIVDKDNMIAMKSQEFDNEKVEMSKQLETVTHQLHQEIEKIKSDMTAKSTAFIEEKELLLTQVSDAQNEATKTQENLVKTLESLENVKLEKQGLQTNLNTLNGQIEALEQDIVERDKVIEVKTQEFEVEKEKLSNKLESGTVQLHQETEQLKQEMTVKLTAFAEEKESLLSKISDAENAAMKTQETLTNTLETLESVNLENHDLQKNLATLKSQIDTLREDIVEKETMIATKTQEFDVEREKMSSQLEDGKEKLSMSESNSMLLKSENEKLEQKLQEEIALKLDAQKALDWADQDKDSLEDEKRVLIDQIKSIQESFDTCKAEKQDLEKNVTELNSKILEFNQVQSGNETVLKSIQEKLDQANQEKQTLIKDVEAKATLENQVSEGREMIESLTTSLKEMKEVHEETNQKLITESALRSSLQNEVNNMQKEKDNLEDQKMEMVQQIQSLQITKESMINQIKLSESSSIEIQKNFEICRQEKLLLEQNVSALQLQIGELQQMKNENESLISNLTKTSEAGKTDLENQLKFQNERIATLNAEILRLNSANEEFQKKLEEEVNTKADLQKALDGAEQNTKDELESQKKRYTAKMQEISDEIKSKYQAKITQAHDIYLQERKDKEAKCQELQNKLETEKASSKKERSTIEQKYKIAKEKLAEVSSKMNEVNTEADKKNKALEAENSSLKKTINLLEKKIREFENRPTSEKVIQDNQSLQIEVKKLAAENRSLQVQNDAADKKIRELQKSSKSASSLPPAKDNDGFLMPSQKQTPGRTRATRTQSEIGLGRRPPQGSGAIFAMDEEAGEMFSNSYLTDLEQGVCKVDSGRISELARRNTMVPAHLK